MHRTRRRGVTALTAAIALAIPVGAMGVATGIVAGGSSPAGESATLSAATDTTTGVYLDAGELVLATGTTSTVTHVVGGDVKATQDLTPGSGCSLGTTGNLLAFDGYYTVRGREVSGAASLANGSIGVAEKKSGVSCSEVDTATRERLVLTVTADGAIGSLLADSAALDLDLKQGANIIATASRGGTPVGTYELQSGSSIDPADALNPLVTQCQFGADSGPDSGANDNCTWGIDADEYFDTLELRAVLGSFSLEGGVDYANPALHRSVLSLVESFDGVLDCGDSDSREAIGSDPAVGLTRAGNADGSDCELIPYTLRNADETARFLKPLDEQTAAQFVLDFVWTVSPANTDWESAADLLPETTIDYESDGDPETAVEIPLRWCPDVTTDEDGYPVVNDVLNNGAAVDQDDVLSGKQFTCILSQDATVVDADPDYVKVEQKVYLLGDAAYRFR